MTGLQEAIDTLQELKRLHQLNIELLEQLDITCGWLLDNKILIPNASTFCALLNKSKALLNEIQADEPKILQYNINRRKVTPFDEKDKTDGEVTEPQRPTPKKHEE